MYGVISRATKWIDEMVDDHDICESVAQWSVMCSHSAGHNSLALEEASIYPGTAGSEEVAWDGRDQGGYCAKCAAMEAVVRQFLHRVAVSCEVFKFAVMDPITLQNGCPRLEKAPVTVSGGLRDDCTGAHSFIFVRRRGRDVCSEVSRSQ